MKYFWKFNDAEWKELVLRNQTKQYYIFEYPQSSKLFGQPWRMKTETVAHYIKCGAMKVQEAQA